MAVEKKKYMVTGAAGFIGFHLAKKLLENGHTVIGIDNFNEYYDPRLKEERNTILEAHATYRMYRGDISDISFVKKVFSENSIDTVCHLAAQAGVRHSLKFPAAYLQANIVGFGNIIDEAKNAGIQNFIFASSSSVYGNQQQSPFYEGMHTDRPLSLYAATKKSNELTAYTYHHLYGLRCTGLRFFTVYGPYGRPDMAYFSFTKSIIGTEPIQLFNEGKMHRDFTYIDDIVEGIMKACEKCLPYEIINLGNDTPIALDYFIEVLEKEIGKKAKREYLPMQSGDVTNTHASIAIAKEKLGWQPKTSIEEGLKKFVEWYRSYYEDKPLV